MVLRYGTWQHAWRPRIVERRCISVMCFARMGQEDRSVLLYWWATHRRQAAATCLKVVLGRSRTSPFSGAQIAFAPWAVHKAHHTAQCVEQSFVRRCLARLAAAKGHLLTTAGPSAAAISQKICSMWKKSIPHSPLPALVLICARTDASQGASAAPCPGRHLLLRRRYAGVT